MPDPKPVAGEVVAEVVKFDPDPRPDFYLSLWPTLRDGWVSGVPRDDEAEARDRHSQIISANAQAVFVRIPSSAPPAPDAKGMVAEARWLLRHVRFAEASQDDGFRPRLDAFLEATKTKEV